MKTKISLGIALIGVSAFLVNCADSAPTLSEVRQVTQKALITADCVQFHAFSQLNPSTTQELEQGMIAKCNADDVDQINSYLDAAKTACTNPGLVYFQQSFTISDECAAYLNSVVESIKTQAANASSSGDLVGMAEVSALAYTSALIGECIGFPGPLSALLQNVDEDDLAAFNNLCIRSDYDALSDFLGRTLNACNGAEPGQQQEVTRSYIVSNFPDLSSVECTNLIQKSLGD